MNNGCQVKQKHYHRGNEDEHSNIVNICFFTLFKPVDYFSFWFNPLFPLPSQSSSDGALSHSGLQEALVDGGDGSHWKPAVFGCVAGLGLAADHAAKGGFLLPPVLR